MDWARAKTILIIIFLALNVFLAATIIYTSNFSQAAEYNRYAMDFLKSRNIEIMTDLSKIPGKAKRILYTTREFDLQKLSELVFGTELPFEERGDALVCEKGMEIIALTDDQLTITDQNGFGHERFNDMDQFQRKAYSYLARLGFRKRDLCLDSVYEPDEKILDFYVKYNGALLFDQKINVILLEDGTLKISVPAKIVKKNTAPLEIISPYQLLVMANLPEGSIVKSVDFGYKQISEGELYATPVWRVVLDGQGQLFFNAVTGEKLDY
mgnify:FL=1